MCVRDRVKEKTRFRTGFRVWGSGDFNMRLVTIVASGLGVSTLSSRRVIGLLVLMRACNLVHSFGTLEHLLRQFILRMHVSPHLTKFVI